MQNFIDVVDECDMKNLGFNGARFTWSNKRAKSNTLANDAWRNFWQELRCL